MRLRVIVIVQGKDGLRIWVRMRILIRFSVSVR